MKAVSPLSCHLFILNYVWHFCYFCCKWQWWMLSVVRFSDKWLFVLMETGWFQTNAVSVSATSANGNLLIFLYEIGELIHFVITFADAKKDVVDSLLRASGCLDYSVHRILVQIPAHVKYALTLQIILAMRNCQLSIFLQASIYCTLPLNCFWMLWCWISN